MPILKFNKCDYNCYGKQTKRGFRVYCRKTDPKCGRPQKVAVAIKSLPFAHLKSIPHLPEYLGSTKPEFIVSKSELEKAIMRARKHAPGEWQAEILEIALIPQIQKYYAKQNPDYRLERVKGGYVLHNWNPPERPYASTAYDGFRRNFYDEPLHGLRSLVLSPEQWVDPVKVNEWLVQDKIGFRNI